MSLISLVKGSPRQNVRREVVSVSDRIDRLRGEKPTRSRLGPSFSPHASQQADDSRGGRPSVPGIGRAARSSWDFQLGSSGLSKISEEIGGNVFLWEPGAPVSFQPHLQPLRRILPYQKFPVFQAVPHQKPGSQSINVQTELAESETLACRQRLGSQASH